MRSYKWKFRKIGGKNGLAIIVNGSTPSTSEAAFWNGNILWVTPTDLGKLNSIYISDTDRKITEQGMMSCSTHLIPANSVLMTSRAPVGSLAINSVPLCTNQGFKAFVLSEHLDSHYLYYYLKHIMPKIQKDSHGNTFTEISKSQIERLEIQLPETLNDQKNIVSGIKTKMDNIEQMRQAALRQRAAIKALQGALLREVFPFKAGDKLPEGWRWEKLGDIAKINLKRKRKTYQNPKELTSFVPMESVDELTGSITKPLFRPFEELGQSYTYFEDGDVIFAKITPCMQNGKCAVVQGLKDGFGFGSSEFIVFAPVKRVYQKWAHYFLRTIELRKNAEDHFTGSAGQQRVPTDYLQKYPIPLPTDEILIGDMTNELDRKHLEYLKLVEKSKSQLEAIEALPAAVLREAFAFNHKKNE